MTDDSQDADDTRGGSTDSGPVDLDRTIDRTTDTDPGRRWAAGTAAGLRRRDYLRALGVGTGAGVVGSVGTSTAAAQSDLDEATADQRIRETQTGPLTVEVIDEAGDPVSGVTVDVEMQDHDFGFGTAIAADQLIEEHDDGDPYREHLLELFNTAVFGNDHKWAFFEDDRSVTDEAVDWLDQRGFDIRGHVCIYPVDYALPQDVLNAVDSGDGETIRRRTLDHIEDIVTHYGDTIGEWDVVNEVLHRGLLHSGVYPDQVNLDDLPAGEIQPWRSQLLADWFGHAESVIDEHDLDVDIVTNDYNTMTWSYARDRYVEQLSFLEGEGIGVDAIGLQGHIGAQKDNSQEWTYGAIDSVFEHYSQFDAAQRVTEFDMFGDGWTSQEQRAEVFERFLKTAYGHPDVDEFLIWGMWDQTHWENESPFFYSDWSEKPALGVWRDLVLGEWRTSETGATGADGTYTVDAFLGDYEVTVTTDAGPTTQTVSVTNADGGQRLVVEVAGTGDDGDGDGDDACEEPLQVGDAEVCDRDGDGLYADWTGDGEVTTADVSEFQANLFGDGVQENAASFNFSGSADGTVSHADVVALFQDATGI